MIFVKVWAGLVFIAQMSGMGREAEIVLRKGLVLSVTSAPETLRRSGKAYSLEVLAPFP